MYNYHIKEYAMKKIASVVAMFVLTVVCLMSLSKTASAEDIKMVGAITKIEVAADKKSATAVLKDTKSEQEVTITITDELTLDKFADKRIVEGDEIRCKYEKTGDKNLSKIFKKTAGC
jgi:hypothetical protein